ncbi:metallophosphoesterase 1 homolog [Phlebotomus papatasi]|uniref:metallophosphoesterase 1 homolog n=1 Tax=Phlebotomus papatasi TaxID=29031 RepID=UPI002483D1A5|nr:metallophosphoesterase 1 homolog [Phlebotomus papatasi]
MAFRGLSPRFGRKFLGIIALAIIFYNEFLVYKIQSFSWKSIPCQSGNCTRILLVADPQLIGETFDTAFYNPIAIYDSDRYLKKTFREVLDHTRPQIIPFLGDLFDEGSVATNDEYSAYLRRFHHIFHTDSSIMKIYVPGDNDIGGENGEIVTPTKLNRFRSTFHTRHTYSRHNLHFFEANRITREIPQPSTPPEPPYSAQKRFVVSHMSLLFYNDAFQERVLHYVKPHVIFTGHLHRSLFIRKSLKFTEFTRAHPLNANAERHIVNSFDLRESHETFLEIMVPTCSYRMGERNIGFGYAVVDGDDLLYTVLWSVDRFSQLFLYLIYLLICFILLTMKLIFTCSIFATKKLQRLRITYTKV